MANHRTKASQGELPRLVGETITDFEKLIGQHFDLLRGELQQELEKAGRAAVSLGAGAGATTLGGVLGAMMLVHLLHDATRLPLWVCYGAVGGLLGAAGSGLLWQGARAASDVRLIPRQTAEVVREELTGARPQLTGARG
jgi:hypothetical protein